MGRFTLVISLAALVLTACSDYELRRFTPVPGPGPTPEDPGDPPVFDPPVFDPIAPPDEPGNPWGDPDPGNLPDLVFVAPWSTSNTVVDFEAPEAGDEVGTLDWSFVAFDLDGQVLLELELPGQEGRRTNPKSVEAAGPGRFLASIRWEDEATEARGWEAWLVDAFTEEMELVATWTGDDGTMVLPQAEREVDLGGDPMLLHLDLWPTDPDLLVVWVEVLGEMAGMHPIRLLHISDSSVPDVFLNPDVLFGTDSMAGPVVPWDLDVALGPDGEPVILGGIRLVDFDQEVSDWWSLRAWSPAAESFWNLDIDWPGIKQEAALGLGAAQPLATAYGDQVEWQTDSTPLLAWDDGGAEVAALPAPGWRRVGPVLEPEGPTVTTVGTTSDGGWRDQLDIFHAGEQVWRIEELRFGLVSRTGFFGQLILLETGTERGASPR